MSLSERLNNAVFNFAMASSEDEPSRDAIFSAAKMIVDICQEENASAEKEKIGNNIVSRARAEAERILNECGENSAAYIDAKLYVAQLEEIFGPPAVQPLP